MQRPPIVVTSADLRSGSAAARSLALEGFTVVALVRRKPRRPEPGLRIEVMDRDVFEAPEASVQAIKEIAARHEAAAILPAGDDIYVLSRHRGLVEPDIRVLAPPFRALLRVADRARLGEIARIADLATPQAMPVDDADHVREAAARFGFPLMVRPRFDPGNDGVVVMAHPAELEPRLRRLSRRLAPGLHVALAPVPGSDVIFQGLAVRGRLLALAGQLVLREVIGDRNGTTARRTLRNVAVELSAGRVLESLGLDGVARLRFRWLPKDGRLWLVDVEPAYTPGLDAALLAGVDLPVAHVHAVLDGNFPPRELVPERIVESRWWPGEIRYAIRRLFDGRPGDAAGVFKRPPGGWFRFERPPLDRWRGFAQLRPFGRARREDERLLRRFRWFEQAEATLEEDAPPLPEPVPELEDEG